MRHPWSLALCAHIEGALFHGEMGPPAANLALGMMFYWYACHSLYILEHHFKNVNLWTGAGPKAAIASRWTLVP